MKDNDKTQGQLIKELTNLRRRISELEQRETGRRETEESLRKSTAALQATINTSLDSVILLNSRGVILYLNEIAAKRMGKSRKKLIGMLADDVFPRNIVKKRRSIISQTLSTGREVRFEDERNGIWFDTIASPILDNDGAVSAVAIIARDVTERRRAEEKLKESESRFRNIIETSTDGIILFDGEKKKIIFGNNAMAKLLRCSTEDLPGRTISSFHPREEWERVEQEFKKHVSGKNSLSTDIPVQRDDGSVFYADVTSGRIMLEGKAHFSAFFRDITTRKQAEGALRESEEKYKDILNGMDDTAWVIDFDGKFVDVNSAAVKVLGYSREELLSMGPSDIDSTLDAKAIRTLIKKMPADKIQVFETTHTAKDGRVIPVEIKSSLVTYGGKRAILSIARDVTERKQGEVALEQTRLLLEAVLEQSPVPTVAVSMPDLTVRYKNLAAIDFLGVTDEPTYLGLTLPQVKQRQTWQDLRPDGTSIDLLSLPLARALRGEIARNEEYRVIRKDGTQRWELVSGTPIYNRSGELVAGLIVFPDITERKLAEENLSRMNERFTLAARAAGFGVWDWDIQKNKLDWDDRMYELYGRKRGDFPSAYEAWLAGVHPDDRAASDEVSRQARLGKREYDTEFRVVWPNDSIHTLKAYGQVIWDSDGNPIRMTGINYDITERKTIEEELRQSEEKYRNLVETMGVGLSSVNSNGVFTYVNDQFCQILGYTMEELLGHPVTQYMTEASRKLQEEVFAKRKKGFRDATPYEIIWLTKDKEELYTITSPAPRFDANGRFMDSLAISIDITERKQATKELQRRQETINAIIETSRDWIWTIDRRGVYTYSNPAIEKILGYCPEEIVGNLNSNLIHEDDWRAFEPIFRACIQERRGWKALLLRWRHKNGGYRYLQSNSVSILNENCDLLGFRGVDRDITEHKELEKTLDREREELKLIIDSSPIIVFYKDKDGRFRRVNKQFAKALKMPEEYFLGKTVFDLYPPRMAQGMADDDREVLQSGRPKFNIIEQYESARGTRWVQTDKIPIFDKQGMIIGLIGFAQDITERKQAEDAVMESETRFRTLFESIPDSVLVHDDAGTILHINEIGAQRLEWSAKDLVGRHLREIVTPENTASISTHVKETYEVGWSKFETTYVARSGWQLAAEVSERPIKFGKQKAILSVARDISKRKQSEQALLESRQRYQTIVDNINDALYIFDFQGNIIEVNENACKMLGYNRKELIGVNLSKLDSQVNIKKIPERIKILLVEQFIVFEGEQIRKDGTAIPIEVSAKVISYEGNGLIQGFVRDITERKQSEKELQSSYRELHDMLLSTVSALASTVEMKDQYTAGHQPRSTRLACAIAEEMGLPQDQIEGIRMASSIHDIGKLVVPAEILNKPGPLTDIQYEMVKMHPEAGYDIVKRISFPWPVAEIIRQHQELLNGSGYPRGLVGNQIMLEARILTVANVVEAMTSHRPYRPAHDIAVALEEISKNRGVLYDPVVVDACLKLFREKNFSLDAIAPPAPTPVN